MAIITRTRRRDDKTLYDVRLLIPGDPDRRQYTAGTFDNKRDAEACQHRELADQSRGVWVDPRKSQTPLAAVADGWLKSRPKKKAGTVERDTIIVRLHVKPVLGNRPVGVVAQGEIQDLVNKWEVDYVPSTVVRHYRVVQAIFNWAVLNDYRGRTPCRQIELPEVEARSARILERIELAGLVAALGDTGLMVYLAVMGPRWGEIAGLKVGRLRFGDDAAVAIEDQRTRGAKGAMVSTTTKRRRSERTLAIPVWLGSLLVDHLAARGGVSDDDYVFVSPDGKPLHYSNWRRDVWLPALVNLDLIGFRFHDLRHVAATRLDEAGVSAKVKEHRLGATQAVVDDVYTQATDPADRAAADLMGEVFRPAPPAATP